MARRSKRVDEREARERLGRRLRDTVLDVYCATNPYHDRPGWEEIKDFSRATWTKVAAALIAAGWRPPWEPGDDAER